MSNYTKHSNRIYIHCLVSILIITSCSKQYVDGIYSASITTGGFKLELHENGEFNFTAQSDRDSSTKGDGVYYIKAGKVHLTFNEYDTLYVSIKQKAITENQKLVRIEILPIIYDNVNCYNLYLKDQVNDNNCKVIRNGELIYVDKYKFANNDFLQFSIDSVMLRVEMTLENMRYETIEYDLKKYENEEFTKKILYSDITHRIQPNTQWIWNKRGDNIISEARLLFTKK